MMFVRHTIAAAAAVLVLAGCGGSSTVSDRQSADGAAPEARPAARTTDAAVPRPDDFPPGKFTVQLGAYQSEEGASKIASLARTRFSQDVFTVFDAADALFKVFLGVFDSKDLARNFRDTIVRRYPEEYRDAWVSDLVK